MSFPKTIKHRRGTAIQWETKNPILKEGEFGVDLDTGQFKLGDGVSHWKELPYFIHKDNIETIQGDKGDTGDPGPLPVLNFSSQTGEPGSQVQTVSVPIDGGYSVVFTIPRGADGYQGVDGQQGPEGPQGIQGPAGPQGPQGIEGPQGVKGDTGNPGTSLTIVDQVPTVNDLPESASPSEGYLTDAGSLYFYGVTSGWVEVGYLRGPEGPQGIQGPQGETGPEGPQGPEGPRGLQGLNGEPGLNGKNVEVNNETFTITTGTLNAGATEKTGIQIAPFFAISKVTTSHPCRVRLYSDTVSQNMDETRVITDTPGSAVGVILDALVGDSAVPVRVAPVVLGSSLTDPVPITITNTGAASAAITVTIHAVAMS